MRLMVNMRVLTNATLRSVLSSQRRSFSARAACRTDGVYSEITAMRTRTPFIEAFKRLKESESEAAGPSPIDAVDPARKADLIPKTMSDSYYRVVCA